VKERVSLRTTLLSNLFLYWTYGFPLSQLSWVHSLSTIVKYIHFPILPYKSCVPCFQAQSLLHLCTLIPCITLIHSTIVPLSKILWSILHNLTLIKGSWLVRKMIKSGSDFQCYLSMKEVSLFCSYEIHRTGMLQITLLVSLESSQQGGVHVLGSMTFGLACKSSWILNDFFTQN